MDAALYCTSAYVLRVHLCFLGKGVLRLSSSPKNPLPSAVEKDRVVAVEAVVSTGIWDMSWKWSAEALRKSWVN
jgi:hypothetical protein